MPASDFLTQIEHAWSHMDNPHEPQPGAASPAWQMGHKCVYIAHCYPHLMYYQSASVLLLAHEIQLIKK